MTTNTTPMPTTGPLVDTHGRTFDYLRIAVTERCNLRCVYCMPEEGVAFPPNEALLSADELRRVLGIVAELGVSKIRYTGGEPLLRKDVVELVRAASGTPGIDAVHITTNGLLFARHAEALRDAGLTGLNVSLDTLDAEKFQRITRRPGLESVLEAVHEAVRLGFRSVKVNAVALRDFNHDEIGAFGALTRDLPVTVRFIELMPFDAHQIWKTGRFFSARWIVEALREAFPGLEPVGGSRTETHVFRIPGHAGTIAVIDAYTRTLCGDCNRIRLTADGKIRNCLYSTTEYDVRDLMRAGADDRAVAAVFRTAIWEKAVDGWAAQKDGAGEPTTSTIDTSRISMTQIGG